MTADTCRDCRRPLKDPESRRREYGPDCWLAHRPPTPGRRPTARAVGRRPRPTQPGPDQMELDLNQETP